MYHHLLVPIDETELSTVTVGRAVEFAKAFGARITFFHAHIDHAASVSGDADLLRLAAPEQFAYSFEGRPVELLTKAEAAARAHGVPCHSVSTVSNSPHRAIVDVADLRLAHVGSGGRAERLSSRSDDRGRASSEGVRGLGDLAGDPVLASS